MFIAHEIACSDSGPHHAVSPASGKAASPYYPTGVLVSVSYQSYAFTRCQPSVPTSKKSPEAWMGSFAALCSQTVQLRVLPKYGNLNLSMGKPNFFWWAAWLTLSSMIVHSQEPEWPRGAQKDNGGLRDGQRDPVFSGPRPRRLPSLVSITSIPPSHPVINHIAINQSPRRVLKDASFMQFTPSFACYVAESLGHWPALLSPAVRTPRFLPLSQGWKPQNHPPDIGLSVAHQPLPWNMPQVNLCS